MHRVTKNTFHQGPPYVIIYMKLSLFFFDTLYVVNGKDKNLTSEIERYSKAWLTFSE